MAWITPKTDWVASDKILFTDFNRITGNLAYLKTLSGIFFNYDISPLPDSQKREDKPYASKLNAIETVLEQINLNTYALNIGDTKIYVANGHPWDYNELNRIESAILKIYQQLISQRDTVMHYPQTFGGSNIYKVARVQYVDEEPIAYRMAFRLGSRKGVF